VEVVEAVQDVLDGAHVRGRQRPGLRGGQPQQLDAGGRVAVREQAGGGVRGGPGEERAQVSEVVIDRRWRHCLGAPVAAAADRGGGQVLAPGGDLPGGDCGNAVVAQPLGEEGSEAVQVPGDLGGDLRGADPADRQVEVALDPDGEVVVALGGRAGDLQHLS
jgi:hypothetical protein